MASPTPAATSSGDRRPKTTKRAQQKAETRARLLAAARTVFGEGSVVTTPLDVVASAAGVSKATLFFHFSDRAELLQGMAAELDHELAQVLEETVATGSRSLRDAVAAYLDAQRDPRARLLWHVGETLDAMHQPRAEDANGMIRAEIAERAGDLVAVLAPAAVRMARLVAGGQADPDEVSRFLAAVDTLTPTPRTKLRG